MSAGPYGVTLSENGDLIPLRPTVLIIDSGSVWRDEYGERLEKQSATSAWERVRTELTDFFGRTNIGKFSYKVPALHLVDLVGLKNVPRHLDPLIAAGVVGFTALMIPHLLQKHQRWKQNRSSQGRLSRSRSVDSMGNYSLSSRRASVHGNGWESDECFEVEEYSHDGSQASRESSPKRLDQGIGQRESIRGKQERTYGVEGQL